MLSIVARLKSVRLGIVGLALALAPGLAAAQTSKPWRHGIINAKADAGILFMSSRGGFAEKEGLKLDVLQVKDDQIGLKALLAGEIDSYEGGVGGAILAAARGADLKLIGCHWLTLPHGIYVRGAIATIADLRGKTVAVSAPGTMPELLARAALNKYSVPVSEVKFAAVGGDRDRFAALVGGIVDAAVVTNEYEPIAATQGVRLLLAGAEAVPHFLRVCLFSTGSVLARRPEDAVRFLTAQMKALRYALSHRDAAVKLTREVTKAKADDPRPEFVYDDTVKRNAVAPELPIPMERLEWMQRELIAAGKLERPTDLTKMVDATIRARALERLGK
jgi:NitT/TauT family transport system substrate-binding protein